MFQEQLKRLKDAYKPGKWSRGYHQFTYFIFKGGTGVKLLRSTPFRRMLRSTPSR
jgi:hypothetical protein